MRRLLRIAGREGGFTMIELMVVMVMLGFLAASFSFVFASTITHSSSTQDAVVLQQEARAAIDRFAGDLRQAYTGDDATYPIEAVSVSGTPSIRFLTPDRLAPFHLRRVTYRFTGGRFERSEAISTDTDCSVASAGCGPPWVFPAAGPYARLVDSITTTTPFSFFDANGASTTNPLNVRTVRLQMTLKTGRGRTSTYGTTVTVRSDS